LRFAKQQPAFPVPRGFTFRAGHFWATQRATRCGIE
jgi:hypothetical protein